MKGKNLIKQYENSKSIFEKGVDNYKKYTVYKNSYKYERITSINNIRNDALIYKVCREEFNKMREACNQIKKYCNNLKSYYEQIKDIYTKYNKQELLYKMGNKSIKSQILGQIRKAA